MPKEGFETIGCPLSVATTDSFGGRGAHVRLDADGLSATVGIGMCLGVRHVIPTFQ